MDDWLSLYFLHLDHITGAVAILIYALHLFWNRSKLGAVQAALGKAISSSGIPNGTAFLICAFCPEYVIKMQGAFVAFLIGGLALASVTMIDVAKPKPAA